MRMRRPGNRPMRLMAQRGSALGIRPKLFPILDDPRYSIDAYYGISACLNRLVAPRAGP
jgi:hypothetical protein